MSNGGRKKTINLELSNGVLSDIKTGDIYTKDDINVKANTTDFKIMNVDDELSTGVAINQYQKTNLEFLDDLKDFKNINSIYKQIEVCNKMFLLESTVSTALDILIDFTINPFQVEGFPEKLQPIINEWVDNVNMEEDRYEPFGLNRLAEDMAYEWFISGNIFLWEVWKDVLAGPNDRPTHLPTKIKLLNPRSIKLDKVSVMAGNPKYFLSPGLVGDGISLDELIAAPKLGGSNPMFKGLEIADNSMPLPNEFLSHIKRRARHYDMWGIPYLSKVIQAVAYKHKLMKLDIQTIEGLVNMITIFKIGSEDPNSPYHKVPPSRIRAFSSLLKNPQASTMMAWPHDIDVITAGPDGKIMEFSDKYKDANADIMRALGVPPILIDGSGNATSSWVTILALVERLEKLRNHISNYFEYVLKKICKENGFEDCNPSIRWSPTNLRDEKTIKTMLLAFYDRGLLPIKIMHEEGRYDHEEMIKLKEIEEREDLQELFQKPQLPFDSPMNNMQKPGNEGGNGRPVDKVKTTQENEVSTAFVVEDFSNKIKDKFREDINIIIDTLENNIINLDRRSKNRVDMLSTAQFIRMEQITQVFSSFEEPGLDSEIDAKLIGWISNNLSNIKKFVTSNIMKISRRKIDDSEKQIFIRGIFSEARRRSSMFVNEAYKNIQLAKLISKNKDEGKVGAIVKTNPNTKCQTCSDLNDNFLSISEIFDVLPIHPHQDFTLEFVETNPILSGDKVNTTVVSNPKNKSKRL